MVYFDFFFSDWKIRNPRCFKHELNKRKKYGPSERQDLFRGIKQMQRISFDNISCQSLNSSTKIKDWIVENHMLSVKSM